MVVKLACMWTQHPSSQCALEIARKGLRIQTNQARAVGLCFDRYDSMMTMSVNKPRAFENRLFTFRATSATLMKRFEGRVIGVWCVLLVFECEQETRRSRDKCFGGHAEWPEQWRPRSGVEVGC
jgi:hypothetical protein